MRSKRSLICGIAALLLVVLLSGSAGGKWTVAGTFTCLAGLAGYYGILAYGLKLCDFTAIWEKVTLKEKYLMGILTFADMWFILRESGLNHVLYCWDAFITWGPAVNYEHQVFLQPWVVLKDLYGTINHADYNTFLGFLMALPLKVIGDSFSLYVLTAWLMFMVPAAILLSIGMTAFMEKVGGKRLSCAIPYALILLLPAVSSPLFFGYVYVSALLPGAVIWLLFLTMDWENLSYKKLTAMAVLFVLLVIQNRTLTYLVVGFLLGLFVYAVAVIYERNRARMLFVRNFIISFIYMGLLDLGIMLIFFHGLFMRSVFNDLKTAYSAYGGGLSMMQKLYSVIDYHGVVVFLWILAGILIGLSRKKMRPYVCMLVTWLVASTVAICMILQMNNHQMYVIIIPMTMLMLIPVEYFYARKGKMRYASGALYVLGVLFIGNFLYAFSGAVPYIAHMGVVHTPVIRHDVDEIKAITSDLKRLSEKNNGKIYVLSSHATLNDDVFSKSRFPDEIAALPTLQVTSHVDLRDGFNTAFLDSDYIVVMDPIQTHMRPQDQQVVVLLAQAMLQDTPLSRHYKVAKEYKLYPMKKTGNAVEDEKNCVKVMVYEKVTPLTAADIDYIIGLFDAPYGNRPDLFRSRLEKYAEQHFEGGRDS